MICTYCENDLSDYNPVSVERDGEVVGEFCNYACLVSYVETNDLSHGDACTWR